MKNKAKQIYPKLDLGMSKGYPFVMAFAFQMDGIRVYTGSWININNYCLKNGILCHAKVIYYNALDHESKKVEKYEILGNDLSNVNRESSFLLRWGSNKSLYHAFPELTEQFSSHNRYYLIKIDYKKNKAEIVKSYRRLPHTFLRELGEEAIKRKIKNL